MSILLANVQILLGNLNASKYYTDHTRAFLGYLGHKNPSAVPIRKISRNDSRYSTVAGYANGLAIYLNEDVFTRNPEGINLYVCAHEAAHYVLGHSYQTQRMSKLEIEQEADVIAARMLCKHGYTWVVRQHVSNLRRLINAGRGQWSDGKHPTNQQEYAYLSEVLETNHESSSYKSA